MKRQFNLDVVYNSIHYTAKRLLFYLHDTMPVGVADVAS